ncbi:MAG: succinate dehydrogenase/fumarate reductase iron-sulfur subunit [Bradyrhizobium sp.]
MNISVDARSIGKAENSDGLLARNTRLKPGDPVRVRVLRFDAGAVERSRFEEFVVPYDTSMRVLDALNYIAEHFATDLAYRWLCGSKMCGTCAVRMNGREVLACWESVEPDMTIEPLRNLPVIRDLVVDRRPYEERVAKFEPWLERTTGYPGFPEPLSHQDMKNASKALDCISCMSCFSACPVVGLGNLTDFAGPAPLVQLAQTALDIRNDPDKVSRALELAGVFNCVSCYKCEEVCPAKIPIVTRIIEPLKAKTAELLPHAARHSLVFRSIIASRGRIDPSELMLRVQGPKLLRQVRRALRLLLRGKINPFKTLFGRHIGAARAASRILDQ